MPQCYSLAEMNEQSRAFWAVQAPLAESRLKDPTVGKFALERIRQQMVNGVPIFHQTPLEYELEQADKLREAVSSRLRTQVYDEARRDFGRRGGQAKKKDKFRELIEAHVAKNPHCSLQALEKFLASEEHMGVIVSFGRSALHSADCWYSAL